MKYVNSENAPKAVGPYSHAVQAGDFLYVSGQLPIDPKTGKFVSDDVAEQTRMSLMNAKAIIEEAGADLSKVVKTTVLLQDIGTFAQMNEVYAEVFGDSKPARAAFEVAKLPLGAQVEIELVVYLG